MAYVIGPISGCHINPAVTLGMLLARKITPRHAVYAWVAQLLGGHLRRRRHLRHRQRPRRLGARQLRLQRLGPRRVQRPGAAIIVEIVFTALLVFVVLSTTGRHFAPGFGGLVAGITLALIHLVTIPVDNTSVNPARSLATAIFADTVPSALGQLWVFIVFPLVGRSSACSSGCSSTRHARGDDVRHRDAARTPRHARRRHRRDVRRMSRETVTRSDRRRVTQLARDSPGAQ